MSASDYLENQIIDHIFRAATFAKPTALHIGLIVVDQGYWAATTVYSANDYVLPVTPNGRLYKCTVGGTSAGSEPTWPTTDGGSIVDGTVTWVEQSTALEAATGSTIPEVSGGSYARVQRDPSDANWTATQGGVSGASSGSGGQTENAADLSFPNPTADWGLVYGTFIADAASAGNVLIWSALTTPKTISSSTPRFTASSLTATAS